MRYTLLLIGLLTLSMSNMVFSQNQPYYDSINKYIKLSKNSNLNIEKRLQYSLKSVTYANKLDVDSVRIRAKRYLSLMYLFNEMHDEYIQINKENLDLGLKLNDSSSVTVASTNLGSFYFYYQKNDSAYYYYSKSLGYFDKNDISYSRADVFSSMAEIQQIGKFFSGAEQDAIKAITILNQLEISQDVLHLYWSTYNLLGIISEYLGDFDEALEYHDKSMSYSDQMDDGFIYEVFSINNKATIYRKQGYSNKSLELFNDLLELRPKYEEEEPTFYPAIILNIGKTEFESGNYDFKAVERNFKECYDISKTLNDEDTWIDAAIYLSKLYLKHGFNDLAMTFANESLTSAKKQSYNEYVLEALLILSDIYDNGKGKAFLREHIALTDSLQKVERTVQNKFARIEFETDKVEEENEKITQQLNWSIIVSSALLFTLLILYIVVKQRERQKEIQFQKDQQKANEEIYNLMLSQQDKVDEARAHEKIRISKELHDGILGRLFGTRLSLDSFNFSQGREAIDKRASYIKELKVIEEDIRKVSHDLSTDFVSGSGFMAIISELIEKQTMAYQLEYTFNFNDDIQWGLIPNKTKINIYRSIQESLQNIYKHANAKVVNISFELKSNLIYLSISDDGDGFDLNKSKEGIGVKNIKTRVEEIGGSVKFKSKLHDGTEVLITIPYINKT